MANAGLMRGAVALSVDEHATTITAMTRRAKTLDFVSRVRMVVVAPCCRFHPAHSMTKNDRPRGCSHSAGFAICSPRGMGDPHDISPRGSWHLSGSNMQAGTGHRKVTSRGNA